jgi:transcription initiation factor TFIIB
MDNTCTDCGSKTLIERYREGTIVCADCGLVIDTIIDSGSEVRSFNVDERSARERTGGPVTNLRADLGLSTQIGDSDRDAMGGKITNTMRDRMRRLKWLNNRTSKSEIRNLRVALRELKRLAAALQLSQETSSTASIYYRKALKAKLIRGRSINSMVAAAVYMAARKHNFAIVIKDLEDVSSTSRKVIARCMRVYIQELKIKTQPTSPNSMLDRLSSKLEITPQTRKEALSILEQVRSMKLDIGKNPISVAAAAVYLACLRTGERRTQQMVAAAALTTPVTLRNRFREISEALTMDIDVRRGAAATPVYFKSPYEMRHEK